MCQIIIKALDIRKRILYNIIGKIQLPGDRQYVPKE